MKRIIVLMLAALMLLAMSALPALADNSGTDGGGPPATSGNPKGAEVFHCNVNEGQKSAAVFNKNNIHGNCRLSDS
jgi:hypothetical protein